MTTTPPTPMRVVEKHANHYWLEPIEGPDKGIRVSVPVVSRDYPKKLQLLVDALEVGAVYEISLQDVSGDETPQPHWRIKTVEEAL